MYHYTTYNKSYQKQEQIIYITLQLTKSATIKETTTAITAKPQMARNIHRDKIVQHQLVKYNALTTTYAPELVTLIHQCYEASNLVLHWSK